MRERLVLEPALVRGTLVTITSVIAFVLGRQIPTDWIADATTVLVLAAPVLSGLWTRRAVTPVASFGTHSRGDA